MRIAIVHYHLQPGGVTRIVQHTVSALTDRGISVVVLVGELPASTWPVPVLGVDALRYEERRPQCSPAELVAQMQQAALQALGGSPDLWHVHNHSLGKNLLLPGALQLLASSGQRLFLQIHDFPEDGRPANYGRMLETVGEGALGRLSAALYPQAAHVHYAVLNGRDRAIMGVAGVADERLHSLPNPVELDVTDDIDVAPTTDSERLWLYPTRAIRRKNLGEFLLWSVLGGPRDRFATTLAPTNPAERPVYERWMAFAGELRLPVDFEIGACHRGGFASLLGSAHCLVTTSVAEGFGMAFLEPWLVKRTVAGRDLPEITAEFTEAGIEYPNLYRRLDMPVAWFGEQALEQHARAGLTGLLRSYGREPAAGDVGRVLDAWLSRDCVDFGRLDEPLQEQGIRHCVSSAVARRELSLPRLPDLGAQAQALERNRQAVLANFGLSSYGARLLSCYREVLESPVEALEALCGETILDQFLAPERLYLLRT